LKTALEIITPLLVAAVVIWSFLRIAADSDAAMRPTSRVFEGDKDNDL